MQPAIAFPTPPTQKIRQKAAEARSLAAVRRILFRVCREIERAGQERRSCACCWRNRVSS